MEDSVTQDQDQATAIPAEQHATDISDLVGPPDDPEVQEIIRRAMDFHIRGVISRYSQDYDLPLEVAKEHEREVKRYLVMCALNPHKRFGMKGPVDDIWHTFLLFTKEYTAFCQKVAGRFIHHVPEEQGTKSPKNDYLTTLAAYEYYFGEAPPLHLWPRRPPSLDVAPLDGCNGSCNGCGGGDPGCDGGCSGCDNCGTDG